MYSKAVAEYLERFTKTENCFMYTLIEKDGILGFLTACEIPGILSRNIKIDTVAIAPEYQNKVYETVSTEETVSLVTEKKQQQLQRKLIPPLVTDLVQKKLHVILFSFAKTKMKFMLTTEPY